MAKEKRPKMTISIKGTDGPAPKPIEVELADGDQVIAEVLDAQGVSTKKVNVTVDGKRVTVDDLGKIKAKAGTNVQVEQRASGS